MKKRFACITIAMLMLVMAVGCTNVSEGGSPTIAPTSATTATAPNQATPEPTSSTGYEMSDIPNMTAPGVLPIVIEPVTLTIGAKGGDYNYDDNEFTKWLTSNTGIELEMILFSSSSAEFIQKFQLMVAANQELPDVLMEGAFGQYRHDYGRSGIFIDLTELIDKYGHYVWESLDTIDEKDRDLLWRYAKSPDGKLYGFPSFNDNPAQLPLYRWYINKSWVEKLNLVMPDTTEDLYNVLKAFKEQDPNGNGKADEIPLIGGSYYRGDVAAMIMNSFEYFTGVNGLNVDDNGQLYVPYATESYREGLRYIKRLVDEGLMSPLTFTTSNYKDVMSMICLEESEVSFVGLAGGHPDHIFQTNTKHIMEYDTLGPLTGPHGVKYAALTGKSYGVSDYITRDCENPEIALRLMDFIFQPEGGVRNQIGGKGISWEDPKPGDVAVNPNYEPFFRKIVVTDPAVLNARKWYPAPCLFYPDYVSQGSVKVVSDNEYVNYHSELYYDNDVYLNNAHPNPVPNLIYTSFESDAIAEISASLQTYANECRALFATGGMDIEKDWSEYISTLETIGIESYLNP